MPQMTNPFKKPAVPPANAGAQTMAQQPGAPPGPEVNPEAEKAGAIGKVFSAIGKALGQPEVPEMLARMGIAFGTSPSGVMGAGARVGQQFIAGQEAQRATEAQGRVLDIREKEAGARVMQAEATKSAAELSIMVTTAQLKGQPITDPVVQQRMFEVQRRVVKEQVYSSMPGDLIITTDPETGEKRTEWVPHDPEKAQALIKAQMAEFTDRMVGLKVWPSSHMYSTPKPEEVGEAEDLGSVVAGAPISGQAGIETVLGGARSEETLQLPPGPISDTLGFGFAPAAARQATMEVPAGINLPSLKVPGEPNSKENPFVIQPTQQGLAGVSNLRKGDYAVFQGQLYIMTDPPNWERVE